LDGFLRLTYQSSAIMARVDSDHAAYSVSPGQQYAKHCIETLFVCAKESQKTPYLLIVERSFDSRTGLQENFPHPCTRQKSSK
jgi:hypothetical protein